MALKVYLLVDLGACGSARRWLARLSTLAEEVPAGQVGIQVRAKKLRSDDALFAKARQVTLAASKRGWPVFLNGSAAQAAHFGYEGVHWSEIDIPLVPQRGLLCTAAVHGRTMAQQAEAMGAQYAVFAPVFSPRSKVALPRGLEALTRVCDATNLPTIALGGITPPMRRT